MPRRGSRRSALTQFAGCSCLPSPVPPGTQPSYPTIVITSAGPGFRARAGPFGTAGVWIEEGFPRGEEGRPEPFDSQGRGGIESARLPLFWALFAARQGGHVEWEGRTRWDPAAPAPTRNRLLGNEWLFLIRPLRLHGSRAKGHDLLTEPGLSLRSDASTWVPISAGQHACLARPSRLDLRGTPRATGSRSSGEGGGDEYGIGTNACG